MADVTLTGVSSGTQVRFTTGCQEGFTFEERVRRDTYRAEVVLKDADGAGDVRGRWAQSQPVDATAPAVQMVLDGRTVPLSGRVLRDGQPVVLDGDRCAQPVGKLSLSGRVVDLSCNANGEVNYSGDFFEGEWHADVALAELGMAWREDEGALANALPSRPVQVSSGSSRVDVDVRPVTILGQVRVGGDGPPCVVDLDDLAVLLFTHRETGAVFATFANCGFEYRDGFSSAMYDVTLVPGTYDVQARPVPRSFWGSSIADEVRLPTLSVSGPQRWNLDLPLPALRVRFKMDGKDFKYTCGARVEFSREGLSRWFALPCDGTALSLPVGLLAAGTYRVRLPYGSAPEVVLPPAAPPDEVVVNLKPTTLAFAQLTWDGKALQRPPVCARMEQAGRLAIDDRRELLTVACESQARNEIWMDAGRHTAMWSVPRSWRTAWGEEVVPSELPVEPYAWNGEPAVHTNVRTGWVEGTVSVDGGALGAPDEGCTGPLGTVVLERPGYRRTFDLTCAGAGHFSGLVPAGTYDVRVLRPEGGSADLPADSGTLVKALRVE